MVDTEKLYTKFWEGIGVKYLGRKGLSDDVKGVNIIMIEKLFFSGRQDIFPDVCRELNEFEASMDFEFIPGAWEFLQECRSRGYKISIVTSSNDKKMANVRQRLPQLVSFVDDMVISGVDFFKGKPDPECFLVAADRLGLSIDECVVFEDSMSGIEAGKASGAPVVGLSTSYSPERMREYCDIIVPDYLHPEEIFSAIEGFDS